MDKEQKKALPDKPEELPLKLQTDSFLLTNEFD